MSAVSVPRSRMAVVTATAFLLLVVLAGVGFLLRHGRSNTTAVIHAVVAATPPLRAPEQPPVAQSSVTAAPSHSPSAPATTVPVVSAGWVVTALHPVSAPVLVEGTVVVYTSDSHSALRINSIDPASGRKIWSIASSVAASPAGQPPVVTHLGNTVFFLGPALGADHSAAQVVAADAATGRARWYTKDGFSFTELPTLCADGLALCDTVHWKKGVLALVRIDVATGVQRIFAKGGSGRRLGPALVDPELRAPEYLEHLDETTGASLWRDKVADLAGSGASSDGGWNWDRYGDVYVGSYGLRVTSTPTAFFEAVRTVGVRVSDGKRLWTKAGWYGCGQPSVLVKGNPVPVRCALRAVDRHRVLENFDVHTGKTLWTFDGGNSASPSASGSFGRIDAEHIAVETPAGAPVQLDLVTGKTTGWTVESVAWCARPRTWRDPDRVDAKGKPAAMATGGLIGPCFLDDNSALPEDGTATGLGVTADGMFVWSAPEGLQGYAIPHG